MREKQFAARRPELSGPFATRGPAAVAGPELCLTRRKANAWKNFIR